MHLKTHMARRNTYANIILLMFRSVNIMTNQWISSKFEYLVHYSRTFSNFHKPISIVSSLESAKCRSNWLKAIWANISQILKSSRIFSNGLLWKFLTEKCMKIEWFLLNVPKHSNINILEWMRIIPLWAKNGWISSSPINMWMFWDIQPKWSSFHPLFS